MQRYRGGMRIAREMLAWTLLAAPAVGHGDGLFAGSGAGLFGGPSSGSSIVGGSLGLTSGGTPSSLNAVGGLGVPTGTDFGTSARVEDAWRRVRARSFRPPSERDPLRAGWVDALGDDVPHAYRDLIADASSRHGISQILLHSVIRVESAYNADAVSPKGAVGLTQLMPGTADRFGVTDRTNPAQSIEAGAAYLSELIERFTSLDLALAAYNAGENAVVRYGNKVPPYPETQHYVRAVLRRTTTDP